MSKRLSSVASTATTTLTNVMLEQRQLNGRALSSHRSRHPNGHSSSVFDGERMPNGYSNTVFGTQVWEVAHHEHGYLFDGERQAGQCGFVQQWKKRSRSSPPGVVVVLTLFKKVEMRGGRIDGSYTFICIAGTVSHLYGSLAGQYSKRIGDVSENWPGERMMCLSQLTDEAETVSRDG